MTSSKNYSIPVFLTYVIAIGAGSPEPMVKVLDVPEINKIPVNH